MQRAKYPRVLYVKPSNKVYLFCKISRFTQEGLRTSESYVLALMLMLASISIFTCHRALVLALMLALVLASLVKTRLNDS